ncbi:MAG: T9SS type A sorting domain-containing protein [Bacteroidetes bacterium]|nr:T9SS type A sorting domain-containing protein [Bacteroidota bacterium]MCW5896116.1 T9SS type A sorting domain-containing protein [Bacteroidota bacterium]
MNTLHKTRIAAIALVAFLIVAPADMFAQPFKSIKQGYTMLLQMDNRGVFGRMAYPRGSNEPPDSLGLEYPVGRRIEHIFGAGVWIAGRVDTSAAGNSPRIKVVTTAYEGWSGPHFEMWPEPNDDFWRASRSDSVKPPGWDTYWGTDLDFRPISDNDLYSKYTDYQVRPAGHVPMGIKVVQSSYAWDDPYAEAIIINEYKIFNVDTARTIEDVYVGFLCDADVGPVNVTNYFQRNFTGYYQNARTAYIHNPSDRGSTPVGISLLYPDPDTTIIKKYTFQWFPGNNTPAPDVPKYDMMASGNIRPDEFPSLSDTRFLFAFGPFTLTPDTVLKIAVGIISGTDLRDLQKNANRAVDIYKNQGIKLPSTPPSPPLRAEVGFRRVKLDWKWRPGDFELFGRPDPETNWDTTSQVARWDTSRISPPYPPGIDPSRGGRNFEAYRLWRSEHPGVNPATGRPLVPDASFTLLKQFDAIGYTDSTRFEYETGLQYEFIDSNLVRGKVYVYSVTSKSIPNIAYQTIRIGDRDTLVTVPVEPLESGKLTNAVRVDLPFAISQDANKVSVVPNPYRTDRDYKLESGGYEGLTSSWTENERKVKFINLPEKCIIRIFSLSGDLVRTVQHDGGGGTFPRGDADVLLVSESNRALASGIYIFTVESNLGVQTGKFVIIR